VATLQEYVNRMPQIYRDRYRLTPEYWVSWVNSLLERLRGKIVFPRKRYSETMDVSEDGEWVEFPPRCRDVIAVRNTIDQVVSSPFEEVDRRIRLYNKLPASHKTDPATGDVETVYQKVIVVYEADYEAITSMDDELPIGDYDNLIEAWLHWKIAENVQEVSPECEYWRSRVDIELRQLRGEAFNRVNVTTGRKLIGFM